MRRRSIPGTWRRTWSGCMTSRLQPGQIYLVKTATAVTPGRVTAVQYAVDVNTLEQKQVPTLGLNEIGVCPPGT